MEESTDAYTKTRGRFGEVLGIVRVLIISFVIVVPIRYFVVQPFIVRGASMEPNFENSEYLIVDELSYYFREPQRGETIVFRYPRDPSQYFIKRIIALPEERVEIKSGKVSIFSSGRPDGFLLAEPYLWPPGRATYPNLISTLNRGEYFVLGDNRDASSDSRTWGALHRAFITGRVVFRAWPLSGFGWVGGAFGGN